MSWQNNWPSVQQPGAVPTYPPPIPGVPQQPSTAAMPDYAALNAEQYKQWQWQQYHLQYAQWHAQYGEQYARETGKSLPPVATPGIQMQPMTQTMGTNPYPTPHPPAGAPFATLNIVAPPPPAEPHPDELNSKKGQDKPPLPEEKSAEEIAFDEQFRKWEQEFETWKRKNKNHPDKTAYREYEQKCMDCRKKLLERREQLRRKRLEQTRLQGHASRGIVVQQPQPPLPPPPPSDPPPGHPPPGPPPPGPPPPGLPPPGPPPSGPSISDPQGPERDRSQMHYRNDSGGETHSGLENVFSNSIASGDRSGGIPGLDLIDEHPPPQPKKIKLEEDAAEEEEEVMEVIDLANAEEEVKTEVVEVNNTANAISSLLNDPKVNALLQLVGSTIAGSSASGNGAGGSNTGGTNQLVAALAQLTNSRTGNVDAGKMPQSRENRPNGTVERNDEQRLAGRGGLCDEVSHELPLLPDFNPRIPPPSLDIDLSRPPPLINGNKRQPQDRWNGIPEQHLVQNGSYPGGSRTEGPPHPKVARFDRPPPPFGATRTTDYQIDPELGRPVAVPKPDWMTEDEYQEIYDRYEHVRIFEERKNKMELAIHVLRQSKIRDGKLGPSGEVLHPVRAGIPKPIPCVKAEIISEAPDEFFQPQQVFDYTNCRNSAPPVNQQTPAGRVIDYGHCASSQYNANNINNRGNNRRDGFRNNTSLDAGPVFGSNTQRFDYNHSRVASVATKAVTVPAEQPRPNWPLVNQSLAFDRSVPGLERLAQMHLNPNPEESNPNYPSKFLLMNDNRPSCLSTKRGKRPSSIRKQKLKQQLLQQQNTDTSPTEQQETSVPKPIVCKEEPPLDLEDLSSDDDTVEERVDGGNSTEDDVGARQIKQEVQDERSESVVSSQSSQQQSAPRMLDIEDLLFPPGRFTRPPRICLLVRGLPGSGKSFLARLIKTKEQAFGPSPRVLSLDDYFLVDKEVEEKDPVTGKITKVTRSQYEFDEEMEEIYIQNLLKAFKRTISERLFNFVIVDCCNHRLGYYCEFHNYARSNGFKVYTCTLQTDVDVCARQNVHNRTAAEIQAYADSWAMAPDEHVQINFNGLFSDADEQDTDTTVADMELAAPEEESNAELGRDQPEHATTSHDEGNDDSADSTAECDLFASKWDNDVSEQNLARLDGISKPLRRPPTLEDYLQLDDGSDDDEADPGRKRKRVRWADVEEQKAQKKMRKMGFVVGVTDWSRMMDPTQGSSALTQTKYIAKIRKNS